MMTEQQKPNLSEMFDLDGSKMVRGFVDRFKNILQERDVLNEDLRELSGEAKAHGFSRSEIAAMKSIAKCQMDGDRKIGTAEKLAAMRRVSNAVNMDLFSWADEHRE